MVDRQGRHEWSCSLCTAERDLAKEMSGMGPETQPHIPLAKSFTPERGCVCPEERTYFSNLPAQKDTFFSHPAPPPKLNNDTTCTSSSTRGRLGDIIKYYIYLLHKTSN